MAGKRKVKKKKNIRFEMTTGGVLGLGVVCFCVFLWMFLLGVWAGQTILLPLPGARADLADRHVVANGGERDDGLRAGPAAQAALGEKLPILRADRKSHALAPSTAEADTGSASLFSLQVESFAGKDQSREALLSWQARGHSAFLVKPDGDKEPFWRVFVGRFESLSAANSQAVLLEKEEGVKVYITLLPVAAVPST